MRRRTLNRLLHLTRAVLLLGAAAATLSLVVLARDPALFDAIENAVRRRHHEPFHAAMAAAMRLDGVAREAALLDVEQSLAPFRRQDQLGELKLACLRELHRLAGARGDHAAALVRSRELAAFDDHDIELQLRLAADLAREPATVPDALEVLRRMHEMFPVHPQLTAARVQLLLAHAGPAAAVQAMRRTAEVRVGTRWAVAWDSGSGEPLRDYGTGLIAQRHDDELLLRFRIDDSCRGLLISLPPFTSQRLRAPRLQAANSQGVLGTIDLLTAVRRGLGADGDALVADGAPNPQLLITLPAALPGPLDLELTAHVEPLPPAVLVDCALLPGFAAHIAALAPGDPDRAFLVELRHRGATRTPAQLFWCDDGEPFAEPRSQFAPWRQAADGRWTATFTPNGPAAVVRLDFPGHAGITFRVTALRCRAEPATDLDVATAPLTGRNDVVRDGADFLVTGTDPYVTFTLPARAQLHEVTVECELR